jgi:hypothetical protein
MNEYRCWLKMKWDMLNGVHFFKRNLSFWVEIESCVMWLEDMSEFDLAAKADQRSRQSI